VYSLGLPAVTLWDTLYPSAGKLPQGTGNNALFVEVVLHGVRPRTATHLQDCAVSLNESSLRPSAKQIEAALKDVQGP
jgi:hypothetical protein